MPVSPSRSRSNNASASKSYLAGDRSANKHEALEPSAKSRYTSTDAHFAGFKTVDRHQNSVDQAPSYAFHPNANNHGVATQSSCIKWLATIARVLPRLHVTSKPERSLKHWYFGSSPPKDIPDNFRHTHRRAGKPPILTQAQCIPQPTIQNWSL